jgi:probable rRNA maturation factor
MSCDITYTTAAEKKRMQKSVPILRVFEEEVRALVAHILRSERKRNYDLSLVFAHGHTTRALNKRYRHKVYTPNVLSFSLSPTSGEVYITPAVAAREAPAYERTPHEHMRALVVHGLLHCLGLDHGPKMDAREVCYIPFAPYPPL